MAGLQAMIGESVQSLVIPGSCVDTYYAGVSNTEKQCFPSKVQNKFYVNFASTAGGSSSTFLFNPNQGVTDIVVELRIPASFGSLGTVPAFSRGWGYRALKNISFRYANSAQYFVASHQHMVSVVESCEDSIKRDKMLELGGQALLVAGDYADANLRTAYVYIKLPHNTPNSYKHLPYPSDLSVQPLQITIELEDWSRLASNGASIPSTSQYEIAKMNFRQVELNDSSDLLARRENMTEKMYVYPLQSFHQRQLEIPLANTGALQTVQLTGFRSGEVSHIVLMAVANADLANGNWFNGVQLQNVTLTINGDVRYSTTEALSALWDLVTRKTTSSVANTIVTAGTPNTSVAGNAFFTVIPMGQESSVDGNQYELTHGYSVMNSVLQLQCQLPSNASGYTLFAYYVYRASLGFSNGQCDYIF
jgi:hypothetical protein